MDEHLREQLVSAWSERPEDIRFPPASESRLAAFEARFGKIPPIFRWFLEECGGGVVGSERVDGIEELTRTHQKFTAESKIPSGWRMKDVFVIGWDGAGNPFGIDLKTGRLLVEDHNFGGLHEMAPSFEAFLTTDLLERR